MASSKTARRIDRLICCIQRNDVKRLKDYVKRRKYKKLNLRRLHVNRRQESLLHLASRLLKPDVVNFLLKHSLFDPATRDSKGNSVLHSALKSIIKIYAKDEYKTVYRNLILPLLGHIPISMEDSNFKGQTLESLLEIADDFFQHDLAKVSVIHRLTDIPNGIENEWNNKLAGELEDEYEASWGRYEEDYFQEAQENENYDSWVNRIIHERRKKFEGSRIKPPPKEETKTSWSKEDQERFLQEEERKKQQIKLDQEFERRMQFRLKLAKMVQNSTSPICERDLPFGLNDDIISICKLITMDVEDLGDDEEAKRKGHRELQRLWHPDKFAQKFSTRLNEEIRSRVLQMITEISQNLNASSCRPG